jgi:hypothetical protein
LSWLARLTAGVRQKEGNVEERLVWRRMAGLVEEGEFRKAIGVAERET